MKLIFNFKNQISTFNFNIFKLQLFASLTKVTKRDRLRDVKIKKLARVEERGICIARNAEIAFLSAGRTGEDI